MEIDVGDIDGVFPTAAIKDQTQESRGDGIKPDVIPLAIGARISNELTEAILGRRKIVNVPEILSVAGSLHVDFAHLVEWAQQLERQSPNGGRLFELELEKRLRSRGEPEEGIGVVIEEDFRMSHGLCAGGGDGAHLIAKRDFIDRGVRKASTAMSL